LLVAADTVDGDTDADAAPIAAEAGAAVREGECGADSGSTMRCDNDDVTSASS
jgi:hypothetical protein